VRQPAVSKHLRVLRRARLAGAQVDAQLPGDHNQLRIIPDARLGTCAAAIPVACETQIIP
jgi:DNA-binding transcriptional ArsR family regulator